jgi:NADH/NAD ratio-sensing transcriptional regulator Rex
MNPSDESHELDLVTVFRSAGTTSEMEALSVQSLLEASGINAVIEGTPTMPNLPEEVRVAREDETNAKRVIAAALQAGAAGAAEAEKQTE